MNKRRVNELIPDAYRILGEIGIMGSDANKNSKWCGQISSFGASIAQGSLLAAVSFFSAQNNAEVDRSKLMAAIARLIAWSDSLYEYVRVTEERKAKEEILNAAVAIKLAMNLYDLGKGGRKDAKSAENES